jgi:hypothetical protein
MYMKKHILFLAMASLCLFFACNDDNDKGSVSPVSNVTATPNIGSVVLTWANPPEADYYYTLVTYQNSAGEQVQKKVSKYSFGETAGHTRAVIGGFEDTNTYTFTLTAYNAQGASSSEVTVDGTPQDANMAYFYIVNTITVNPLVQGGRIRWENEYQVPIYVNISYRDGKGNTKTERILSAKTDSIVAASFIEETTITVSTESVRGDVSEIRQLSVTPGTGELDQSAMRIHSISSVWQDPYPGENIIDGNVNTYWHSALVGYPHWVIFDLGTEYYVNWLELVRRQEDSGNGQWSPTRISWEYSLNGTTFTPVGEYDFDNSLIYNHTYKLEPMIYARYIKLNCLAGGQAWTHMAEFVAYYADKADKYADEAAAEMTPEEPDPDDDDFIDPNTEYFTFNLGATNHMEITQSEANQYEYAIVTTGGDPFVSVNGFTNAVTGTVLVFHYKASADFEGRFYWCDAGGGAAGGRESPFNIPKNDSGEWKTYRVNLGQEMTTHNWAGNPGDFMRFDFGQNAGVTINIRNIRFREAREGE